MRLGVDLDGTVADLQTALAREASRLFPAVDPQTLPRSADPSGSGPAGGEPTDGPFSISGLSQAQQRVLWHAVLARENFWETLGEIEPGGLARLARLVHERHWEVIFLTSRPESDGDTAQEQSHRWLAAHGFDRPSVFVVHGSRGRIAAALALDVVVDDRVENCVNVALESSARPILVWRGGEADVPSNPRELGIGMVETFGGCLDLLEQVQREDEEVGLMERVRQLFGLTSPDDRQRSIRGRGGRRGRKPGRTVTLS